MTGPATYAKGDHVEVRVPISTGVEWIPAIVIEVQGDTALVQPADMRARYASVRDLRNKEA